MEIAIEIEIEKIQGIQKIELVKIKKYKMKVEMKITSLHEDGSSSSLCSKTRHAVSFVMQ